MSFDTTVDKKPKGLGISDLPVPSPPSTTLPTIAIISLGEMGIGIATLLSAYHYPLITSLEGRSAATKIRAATLGIRDASFSDMVSEANIFISVVPPSQALALAEKVAATISETKDASKGTKKLTYLDLNALSPSLSRQISKPILSSGLTYIDGSILGFPPNLLSPATHTWFRPGIPISGPQFPDLDLARLLNMQHISPSIGAASGLKMCFGAINKSLTAVTIQAYTTAAQLGILPALREQMGNFFPDLKRVGEDAMVSSQRKAYRWIKEMEEVAATFEEEGEWDRSVWDGVGGVFDVVANKTELSREGRKGDVEGVAEEVRKALRARRKSL